MRIENTNVFGLENAIRCSKYPMSTDTRVVDYSDPKALKNLTSSQIGSGHDNLLNGIIVQCDLTISNKAWVEVQRYHFLDFISSQSTMHKITKLNIKECCNNYVWNSTIEKLNETIDIYNSLPDEEKNSDIGKKLYLEILYNVPSGFELTAGITTNYRQLKTIYYQRRNHRLPDWQMICDWIETLPRFKELVIGE